MTEKEKMVSGLPCDSWDGKLVSDRKHAKTECHKSKLFNPAKWTERMSLLMDILSMQGKAHIEPDFFCDYGWNIEIGNNFYSNHNLTIIDVCKVLIGDNGFLGPNVIISAAAYPIDPVKRQKSEYGAPISIGNDVWVDGNVSILPGVNIGDSSVIGAGSVVTRDVPNSSVAVGSPCRVIRSI